MHQVQIVVDGEVVEERFALSATSLSRFQELIEDEARLEAFAMRLIDGLIILLRAEQAVTGLATSAEMNDVDMRSVAHLSPSIVVSYVRERICDTLGTPYEDIMALRLIRKKLDGEYTGMAKLILIARRPITLPEA